MITHPIASPWKSHYHLKVIICKKIDYIHDHFKVINEVFDHISAHEKVGGVLVVFCRRKFQLFVEEDFLFLIGGLTKCCVLTII